MNLFTLSPSGLHCSSRRDFLRSAVLTTAFFAVPGLFAEELSRQTPRVTEGPFYPPKLPLDTDNDLLIVNDSITPAVGEVAHVHGRLLDQKGDPIRNATIELWQADHSGIYLAERSRQEKLDANFQGFGRFMTDASGEYYFRTIKPVPYTGRPAPHIHFKVKAKGREPFTTQLFVKGEPGNERDGIWRRIGDDVARSLVTAEFKTLEGTRTGEVAARFDIVLGLTAEA